jgi:hypothetical protein
MYGRKIAVKLTVLPQLVDFRAQMNGGSTGAGAGGAKNFYFTFSVFLRYNFTLSGFGEINIAFRADFLK